MLKFSKNRRLGLCRYRNLKNTWVALLIFFSVECKLKHILLNSVLPRDLQ